MDVEGNRVRGGILSRRDFLVGSGAAIGLAVVAGACGTSTKAAANHPAGAGGSGTGTLAFGQSGTFTTLNPWDATEGEDTYISQIFSRLVYKDKKGQPVADLAKSWVVAPDGKSVTFKLRSGLKWQDGTDVLASDFTRMFGYFSDPTLATSVGINKLKPLFKPVTSVTAPDATTVVMQFSTAVPYYLELLSDWYLLRIDDPSDLTFIKKPPVGTGPFKVTSFTAAQRLSLDAYPDYYVKGKPLLKSINFDAFGATTDLVSNLRSGLVNGIEVSDFAQLNAVKGSNAFYVTQQGLGIWIIQVNVSKPPFDNVSVRQALSYSLDRNQIAKIAFNGFEQPVSTPFFAPSATGYVDSLVHAQAFDLNKAKSLLDSAGVKNLTINYPTPTSDPPVQTVGEIWQADLAKIGVTLKIQPVTKALWLQLGEAKVNATTTDVVPWNSAHSLQDGAIFWETQSNFRGGAKAPLTRFGYHNPTLESLVAQGSTETNPATRKQIYQQLNHIVVNDAYEICFATHSRVRAFSSKVSGVTEDLLSNLTAESITVAS